LLLTYQWTPLRFYNELFREAQLKLVLAILFVHCATLSGF